MKIYTSTRHYETYYKIFSRCKQKMTVTSYKLNQDQKLLYKLEKNKKLRTLSVIYLKMLTQEFKDSKCTLKIHFIKKLKIKNRSLHFNNYLFDTIKYDYIKTLT